ncbi:MAG TPA: FkbM family methyltransferase [Verrucomicrobiae bacterium]|nr:FkbM family methyltransferase [Verrucomicrobiae bacterium]
MLDLFGNLLRLTPAFRGKWRLVRLWEKTLNTPAQRLARLPGGGRLLVNLSVPFERMIWLEQEEWSGLMLLRKILQPGDTFVDVGANLGTWTITAATAMKGSGQVLAIEPNPPIARRLQQNVKLNGVEGHTAVLTAALSNASGQVWLDPKCEHNLSTITAKPGRACIQVPAYRLSDALEACGIRGTPTGIKVDAEGHEPAIIDGLEKELTTAWPWLIIEFNTAFLSSNRLGAWEVYSRLTALDYQAFAFTSDRLDPLGPHWQLDGYANLLFARQSTHLQQFHRFMKIQTTRTCQNRCYP